MFFLCSFLDLFYFISDSPYDFQVTRILRINLNLLSDMADMYRYSIVRPDGLLIPDVLVNLIDRKYLSLIFHK